MSKPTAGKKLVPVDHTYTDYSIVGDDDLYQLTQEAISMKMTVKSDVESSPTKRISNTGDEYSVEALKKKLLSMYKDMAPLRKHAGGVVKPFPEKLMEILCKPDIEHIIGWMPHGRAFAVHRPNVFVLEVLPLHFKQSTIMSFTRQLNLWGFRRISQGKDAGAYYHELFLRGRPRLLSRMRRLKLKGLGIKTIPNPDCEPDFYELAKTRPLPHLEGSDGKNEGQRLFASSAKINYGSETNLLLAHSNRLHTSDHINNYAGNRDSMPCISNAGIGTGMGTTHVGMQGGLMQGVPLNIPNDQLGFEAMQNQRFNEGRTRMFIQGAMMAQQREQENAQIMQRMQRDQFMLSQPNYAESVLLHEREVQQRAQARWHEEQRVSLERSAAMRLEQQRTFLSSRGIMQQSQQNSLGFNMGNGLMNNSNMLTPNWSGCSSDELCTGTTDPDAAYQDSNKVHNPYNHN
eukprot:CAMPEP_0194429030 /NCGR_PEP_ID=MMETSP0176-20130528/43649_1 /TAXON_ID=216777 /ORGANISM="Proboscia alata, Strain PI-D3" /LENGTH=458 /DNA_ID=CAMNT_0039241741 /DNA_START=235 /DNA_END=1611 /DNA_ORIENTATION=+